MQLILKNYKTNTLRIIVSHNSKGLIIRGHLNLQAHSLEWGMEHSHLYLLLLLIMIQSLNSKYLIIKQQLVMINLHHRIIQLRHLIIQLLHLIIQLPHHHHLIIQLHPLIIQRLHHHHLIIQLRHHLIMQQCQLTIQQRLEKKQLHDQNFIIII